MTIGNKHFFPVPFRLYRKAIILFIQLLCLLNRIDWEKISVVIIALLPMIFTPLH